MNAFFSDSGASASSQAPQNNAGSHDDWIDRRYWGGDLPVEAERALHLAARNWTDDALSEAYIKRAQELAPGHLAVLLGAYKYYFYKNRLEDALPLALACVAYGARQLNIPADWRQVSPEDAEFGELLPFPRFFLFSLKAYGYVNVRVGRMEEGIAALEKVAALDGAGRMDCQRLLTVIARAGRDEDYD